MKIKIWKALFYIEKNSTFAPDFNDPLAQLV